MTKMKNKICVRGTQNLLSAASKQIIQFHPNASYSASSTNNEMSIFVNEVIAKNKLNRKDHLKDLLIFRQKFEKAISKKYGVKFSYQTNENLEEKYKRQHVPQNIKVQSGILDLIIGRLNTTVINVSSLFNEAA